MMRNTRLGIGSFCYPYAFGMKGFLPKEPMDAFCLVDKAVSLDVSVVQIGDNYPLHHLPWETLKRLKAYASQRDIALEIGMRGIQQDRLEQYVEIAEVVGAKMLRAITDSDGFQPEFDEIVGLLQGVVPALERADLMLGLENHSRFSSDVLSKIIDTLGHPRIGIVLDTVNSFACEENTRCVLDRLARHTINFHVKDFRICRAPNNLGLEITGAIAGQGFLAIPSMLGELRTKAKSDFSTILELWMKPDRDIETTVLKEDRWVNESIAFLKSAMQEKPWSL